MKTKPILPKEDVEEELDRLFSLYWGAEGEKRKAKNNENVLRHKLGIVEEEVKRLTPKARAWESLQKRIKIFGKEEVLKDTTRLEQLAKDFIVDSF